MNVIALMRTGIPPGPDNFKGVIRYQTLQILFHSGFEKVANIVLSFETNFR